MNHGSLDSINVSNGGVPKLPRDSAAIREGGVEGDRQRNLDVHGGPYRAVCLYSRELIAALREEGHPIAPGAIGENLTLSGVDWALMTTGAQLEIGEVVLQLTTCAAPCRTIRGAFRDGNSIRVSQKRHPGWSRWYARVVKEGRVSIGDPVRLQPARKSDSRDH
jgi:MOSC domain-containing protein YiiM